MRRAVGLLLVTLATTGCVRGRVAWQAGPDGVLLHDRAIRTALAAQQFGSAFQLAQQPRTAVGDGLLATMHRGLTAYYAGDLATSTNAFALAHLVADDRYTKSLRRGASAMLSGDAALAYDPTPAERWFIPLYGAFSFLRANDREGAGVEARRLAGLLQRADERDDASTRSTRAALRYINGALFEQVGEFTDAEVAYRNAALLAGDARILPLADSTPLDSLHGEVVVVLERGFAGHLEERGGDVWLDDSDVRFLRTANTDQRWERANVLGGRLDQRPSRRTRLGGDDDDAGIQFLAVRYPVFVSDRGTLGSKDVDLADAFRAEWEREQPARVARAVARGALRLAALHAGKNVLDDASDEKKNGKKVAKAALGVSLLGLGFSGAVVDRADTRSWSLLPGRITLQRVRVPVGTAPLIIEVDGTSLDLGPVTVRPRGVTVVQHRQWTPLSPAWRATRRGTD
ncbi:MAG: hypothetical protein K2X99_12960 [Gemmatimonadaceae bacterium]|nr:hypothetical protein [Gemmatimonadaceae bacterium]